MMKWFSEQIEQRGLIHDWTKDKFFNTMWEGFEEHRKIKDGAKWKKWCKLHIKKERHHFTEDDTYLEQQTDLVDLIEWVCDTCCAGMARNGTYTYRKISSKTLQLIVKNTVDKILKEVEIIKKDR
jgi:HD superfamily phosphohydrolase YqeK